jgi:hypothetical protein
MHPHDPGGAQDQVGGGLLHGRERKCSCALDQYTVLYIPEYRKKLKHILGLLLDEKKIAEGQKSHGTVPSSYLKSFHFLCFK